MGSSLERVHWHGPAFGSTTNTVANYRRSDEVGVVLSEGGNPHPGMTPVQPAVEVTMLEGRTAIASSTALYESTRTKDFPLPNGNKYKLYNINKR